MTCEYCGATLVISGVPLGRIDLQKEVDALGLTPEEAERARMKSLQMQLRYYEMEENPYRCDKVPPGLEYIAGMDDADEDFIPVALEALRFAAERCQASDGDLPDQRAVWWLATKLWEAWSTRGEALQASAVLETALGLVTDLGFRQLLVCSLADAAGERGDPSESRRLLSQCDPKAPKLDLDTAYRTALAKLHLRGGDHQEALALVGERYGEIPCAPPFCAVFHSIRIHALQSLGRGEDAEEELDKLIGDLPEGALLKLYQDRPFWEPAKMVLAAYRIKTSLREAETRAREEALNAASRNEETASPEVVPDKPGATWLWLAGATLLLSIVGLYLGYAKKAEQDAMRGWKRTRGVVTATGVKTDTEDKKIRFYPDVRYRYEVDGRTYRSDHIGPHVEGYASSVEAQRKAERYRGEQNRVTVYYDPEDPSNCALDRTPSPDLWSSIALCVLGILVGLGFLIYYFVRLSAHKAARKFAALS